MTTKEDRTLHKAKRIFKRWEQLSARLNASITNGYASMKEIADVLAEVEQHNASIATVVEQVKSTMRRVN